MGHGIEMSKSNARRKVVILTAVSVEFRALHSRLSNSRLQIHPSTEVPYTVGEFGDWQVALLEIGPRNSNAASETVQAITHFQPEIVMFVGVAGGLKDVSIGDVVVATSVYGYHSGKATDEGFQPRPDVAHSSRELVGHARVLVSTDAWWQFIGGKGNKGTKPKAIVAPIAAGDEVVASNTSETAELVRKHYSDARALEMEGHGVLTAARLCSNTKAIIIRGISDLLSGKSVSDQGGSQELASRHAAAMAVALLDQISSTPPPETTGITPWTREQLHLIELHGSLINGTEEVSTGLRKALRLLGKMSQVNASDLVWIKSELNGYSDEQVATSDGKGFHADFPTYRILRHGALKTIHPINGIKDVPNLSLDGKPIPELEKITSPPCNSSVPELEATVKEGHGSVTLSLSANNSDWLMTRIFKGMERSYSRSVASLHAGQMRPFLEYPRTRFISLLESVRSRLIEVIESYLPRQ